jgi:hypothetical protein
MDSILTGLICGFTNAARGQSGLALEFWGYKIASRWIAAIMCGSTIALGSNGSGLDALALILGVFTLLVFGWGKYFTGLWASQGTLNRAENEFYPADKIADWINPARDRDYCYIAFFMRFWLCSIPLCVWQYEWWGLGVSVLFGIAGAGVYAFGGWLYRKYALTNWVRLSELLLGFLLGVMV